MGYTHSQAMDFINKIGPIIAKHAKELGYKCASPIIAQAVCESAAGTSGLSAKYHNYFGLKAGSQKKGSQGVWDGTVANLKTKEEYTPGTLTTIKDYFRVYKDMDEGVRGYFEFLCYPRYSNLKSASSPTEFIQMIMKDGYCTSTTYHKTCMGIIDKYDLTKFDWDVAHIVAPTTPKKPVADINAVARAVIAGKYGSGEVRKRNLENAGYDYAEVQKRVNEILKGK